MPNHSCAPGVPDSGEAVLTKAAVGEADASSPTAYVYAYAGALMVLVATVFGGLVSSSQSLGQPLTVGILAIAALVAQRSRVRVASGVEQSLALLPTLCAAVLFGSLAALIVGAASMLVELRAPYLKWSVYSCTRALNGAAMGAVASASGAITVSPVGGIAVAAVLAAFTAEIGDVLFAALTYRVRGNPMRPMLASLIPLSTTAVPIYGSIIALLSLAYHNVSLWTLPLFLLPAIGVQRLFVLYQDQREYAVGLSAANDRLRHASLSFAAALVSALDARDSYTAGHSAAVAIYSRDIAKELGLCIEEQQLVYQSGLVHDIGKIALPVGIIEKEGTLTPQEFEVMQAHSEIGESMLRPIEDFSSIALVVRHHHERFDGAGYPDGIGLDSIPLHSRILAVADAYNAMTSDRPYRGALPPTVARARLHESSGSQFDPLVVDAFHRVLDREGDLYRLAKRREFSRNQATLLKAGPIGPAIIRGYAHAEA